ncbi:MAG: preprotein translocase subunit YajC [Candidatus Improbicoccus devescovinae]|nr:MAG: preprotein translocase subunit YajC [Candidatus Improbicoccus devescovinae]
MFNSSGGIFKKIFGNVNLMFALLVGGTFLILTRMQNKKKKQEAAFRNSIKIGDEIVTIGGIIGKIINLNQDSDYVVIESGSERIKLRKWAISSVNCNTGSELENNKSKV